MECASWFPGTNMVGIEVANDKPSLVPMKSVLDSAKFKESRYDLPIVMGKSISKWNCDAGQTFGQVTCLAGPTGQKSVALECYLASLLYKMHPAYLKLVLLDPKRVELNLYSKLENHFLQNFLNQENPIIIDTKLSIHSIVVYRKWMPDWNCIIRPGSKHKMKQKKFLERVLEPLKGTGLCLYCSDHWWVCRSYYDGRKDVEGRLRAFGPDGAACGIHLVIATQRPTNIITEDHKANFLPGLQFG